MEENKRAFKGIWIPKEVWESKELTLQQKVMLVEIDSLDNDDGCFASNKYFSDFFGISSGRVSQIINNLIDKGYLKVEYQKKDKQILGRIMKIQSPPYPQKVLNILKRGYLENDEGGIKYSKEGYLENDEGGIKYSKEGYLENDEGGIKYSKEGYLENDEDNNTYINNINNNISSSNYLEKQFVRTISPLEYEKINRWEETFTDDIINYAIDIAVLNNKKSFSYIEGILRNWKTSNYKTLKEIKENEIKKEEPIEELFDYNWLEEK